MQRRFILKFAAALSAVTLFAGVAHADEAIKMGVTGGPHAQIMEVVKQVAAKNGLKITVVEFSDYVQPNAALAAGDLDANSYQHAPYLDAQVKDRGYKLIKLADTVTFPMGIYSKKIKSLAELQPGARIAVPNDPTNGGRALLLLQKQGLLKLRADAGLKATPLDVVDNPKKLKIVELDAAQIPR
jgi:D-methionine transport system substrate-binding protein